jgi:urease accessory protein
VIIVDRLPDSRPLEGSQADPLMLTWEAREKTRQRVRSRAGREFAIKLATGTRLPPGTMIWIGCGFHVEVAAEEEDVWVIRSVDARVLARVSYEIGNRHHAIEIGAGEVAVRHDATFEELWRRIGVVAERARRPFLGELGPPHAQPWGSPQRIRSA